MSWLNTLFGNKDSKPSLYKDELFSPENLKEDKIKEDKEITCTLTIHTSGEDMGLTFDDLIKEEAKKLAEDITKQIEDQKKFVKIEMN